MFSRMFGTFGRRRPSCPQPSPRPDWPGDDDWRPAARFCPEFSLDAGYGVTDYVPGWLLPARARSAPRITLPNLPLVRGHVLTADAAGHEDELIRHFAQLPPLPHPTRRTETAEWNSLEVNVVVSVPGVTDVIADMFAPSWREADALLGVLADTAAPPDTVYDNLDQGWAVRIEVTEDAVLVLDWNWEADDPQSTAYALRLPRAEVAAQAAAARDRLLALHAALVAAIGRDLWFYPAR